MFDFNARRKRTSGDGVFLGGVGGESNYGEFSSVKKSTVGDLYNDSLSRNSLMGLPLVHYSETWDISLSVNFTEIRGRMRRWEGVQHAHDDFVKILL